MNIPWFIVHLDINGDKKLQINIILSLVSTDSDHKHSLGLYNQTWLDLEKKKSLLLLKCQIYPLLAIRKKTGLWHFCIGFHILDWVTMPIFYTQSSVYQFYLDLVPLMPTCWFLCL